MAAVVFYLLVALILAEGLICAVFPRVVKNIVDLASPQALRIAGAVEVAFAVIVVALSR